MEKGNSAKLSACAYVILAVLAGGTAFLAGHALAREIACRRNWDRKMEMPLTIRIVDEKPVV